MAINRRRSSAQRLMKSMENRDVRVAVLVVLLLPVMTVMALYLVLSREQAVLQTTVKGGLTEHVFPLALTLLEEEEEGLCILNTDAVFIHTPACGSDVVQSVLFRFGFQKDLFVTLPVRPGNPSIGSGEILPEDFLHPSVNFSRPNQLNILAHRARYDKDTMRKMFPETAQYVTILRHPLPRFETDFFNSKMYRYLSEGSQSGAESLKDYLDEPKHWEARKSTSYCTRNCMSAVLGFPLDETMNMRDTQAAIDVIKQLDSDFALVLIYEYLDQSLVLLKRHMCWKVQDIIYDTRFLFFSKVRNFDYRPRPEDLAENFRRLNMVDYLLYEHFNRTLWAKIAEEGPEFDEEVDCYRNVLRKVSQYCRTDTNKTAIFRKHKWHEKFRVNRDMCKMLLRRTEEWDGFLRRRYYV
ncbi:galactose-3-O-sulfotransferase 3-like [Branchiostoma lanceolatum]|uniref:galactose-3-O-sulfotransferase 3-like n=1 Tax=Branchiostoma lanceolatum TaxID=7740 RepID=UPI0034523D0C